jgi:hypothetical protein
MGSFLPSQISAMIFAPVGFLYLWLGIFTKFESGIFIGVFCLAFMVIMTLLSPNRDDSEGDWGYVLVAGACLVLASLPAIASIVTPGLCTDGTNMYEGTLLVFMYLSAVLIGHSTSKAAFKKRGPKHLKIVRLAPLLMTAALAVSFLMYRDGLCMTDNTYMLFSFAISIPLFGVLSFYISALRRFSSSKGKAS